MFVNWLLTTMRINGFVFLFYLPLGLSLVEYVSCWRLDVLGIDENEIEMTGIAVYRNRAFVAMPRVHNHQRVTLAEFPWPERSLYTPFNTKPFPDMESQSINDCAKLQSAVTLDIDKTAGRLYVLDKGLLDVCPPKIIVYDVTNNEEILQRDLQGVPADNLTSLVVDMKPKTTDVRVIVGDAGNNSLLLYDLNSHSWWKLMVTSMPNSDLEDNFIDSYDEPKHLSLNQLAISRSFSILYATSSERSELYFFNLEDLRNMEEPLPVFQNYYDANGTEVSVKHVGDKFGPSSAMFVDFRGDLYYVYKRDKVVLKWNPMKPFITENIDVVMQNDTLIPNVSQIFSGPLYQVWALNSRKNSQSSYTVKLKTLRFL